MTMIRHFSGQDIVMMEQRSRAAFINSLSGFKSVSLVGTANNEGLTNLAICKLKIGQSTESQQQIKSSIILFS